MKFEEYRELDAVALAALVRDGEVAPEEPVKCALEAAARLDPAIGAMAELYTDRATRKNVEAAPSGPFRGVPFFLKDLICHEDGQTLEFGSRLAKGLQVPGDTDLARRFREAGLIILGRTKSPEMGFNLSTENVLQGPVHNPWRPGYSSGGSSGGSAAAVAAGILPAAHANDGGGSIRIPASCCGLVGLKPTRGRVPIGPDYAEGLSGFGIEHVLSRSVRDSAALLDCVEGPGVGDPFVIPGPRRLYACDAASDPARLKIALWTKSPSGTPLHPDVAAELERTASLCRELGHTVDECQLDLGVSFEEFMLANARIWCASIAYWVGGLEMITGRQASPDTLEATTIACVKLGSTLSAADMLEVEDILNRVNRSVGSFFCDWDVVLSPTLPEPPAPHGTHDANAQDVDGLAWTTYLFNVSPFTPVFNTTGLPAISLPLGWSEAEGLPVGMQFGARFGAEDTLLQLAGQLERAAPWNQGKQPPALAED